MGAFPVPVTAPAPGPNGSPGSMVLLQDIILSQKQPNFDFVIPPLYRDLLIKLNARLDNLSDTVECGVNLNGDFGANYSDNFIRSDGGTVTTGQDFGGSSAHNWFVPGANALSAFVDSFVDIYIADYRNPAYYKNMRIICSCQLSVGYLQEFAATSWRNAAPIREVTISPIVAGNFIAGSRCSLYASY